MRYGSLWQKDAQLDLQDKVKRCHISEPRRHDASLRSNREKPELKPQPFTGKGGWDITGGGDRFQSSSCEKESLAPEGGIQSP